MTDEVRVNHKNDRVEAATGEPSGSPETPSTGPLRGQAAPPPTTEEVAGSSPADELQQRLEAAEAKADEHLNDLKRLAAEFDNYRKRTAREQLSMSARANERLVKELLPVLDDLQRALHAAEQHEEGQLEEGVALVHRSLEAALKKEGLAEIETNGRFDPHVHEALLSQPSEAEEGSVIQVLQKGYRLGDRVVRPARVVVAAALPDSSDSTEKG